MADNTIIVAGKVYRVPKDFDARTGGVPIFEYVGDVPQQPQDNASSSSLLWFVIGGALLFWVLKK